MSHLAAFVRGLQNMKSSYVAMTTVCRRYTSLVSSGNSILNPHQSMQNCHSIQFQQIRNYKVRAVLKKRCAGCYFERRFGRLYVECTLKPRHKQMQQVFGRDYYRDDYSTQNWKKSVHWEYNNNGRFYKLGDNNFARYNWLDGRLGKDV